MHPQLVTRRKSTAAALRCLEVLFVIVACSRIVIFEHGGYGSLQSQDDAVIPRPPTELARRRINKSLSNSHIWLRSRRFEANKRTLQTGPILRKHALNKLKQMEGDRVFDTSFSSQEHVLQHGFPRLWNSCALEQRLLQKEASADPLRIVVLGGSCSTRPGNDCIEEGPWPSMLQAKLLFDGPLEFEVVNMAQGGTTTYINALLMDELVDPNRTDVIVWEFLVNDDAEKGAPQEQVQSLHLWLTRIKVIFGRVGKLPPPILINFLWGAGAANRLASGRTQTVDQGPMQFASELIDNYRDLGWNIEVLNVGGAAKSTILKDNPTLLFDDSQHPNCEGAHFIADLIQHAIYTNLATSEDCSKQSQNWKLHPQTGSIVPPHDDKFLDDSLRAPQPLWEDLVSEDTTIGSIMAWEPHVQNLTSLHIQKSNLADMLKAQVGKESEGRTDRKTTYIVPRCGEGSLDITLLEPDLKWLGLNQYGNLSFTVNGAREVRLSTGQSGGRRVSDESNQVGRWIEIKMKDDPVLAKTDPYYLSFCNPLPGMATLFFMVAVFVPNASRDSYSIEPTTVGLMDE